MENLELSQRTGERPEPYRCVWDRFVDVCNRHVNLPAIIVATGVRTSTLNESMSYSELHLYASRLARWLEQSHDIGRGSRIATLLPIGMDGGLIFWAAMRLQATFIPINAVLRKVEHEFIAILNDLKPNLIVSDNGGDIHGLPSLAKILSVGDLWAQIGLAGDDHCPNCLLDDVEWGSTAEAADPAICFLTSGTSSTPKACIHSQLSLSSAALAHKGSRCVQPNDLLCQQMPQFHAYGFSMSLAFWLAGGTVVFPSPSFDASASVEAINNYACTTIAAVPTMIHALTNYIATATAKPTSVRSIDIAGSVVHKEVLQSCFDSLGARKVAPSYGMTECPSVLATTDHDIDRTVPAKDEIASSGCPTPGVTAKICAVGSRKAVPIGENGVLHLSGPTVVSGYVGDREPEAFYQGKS
jgi:acyl-CoA synthetase (AMP-forming)/AMP-acid ligase II